MDSFFPSWSGKRQFPFGGRSKQCVSDNTSSQIRPDFKPEGPFTLPINNMCIWSVQKVRAFVCIACLWIGLHVQCNSSNHHLLVLHRLKCSSPLIRSNSAFPERFWLVSVPFLWPSWSLILRAMPLGHACPSPAKCCLWPSHTEERNSNNQYSRHLQHQDHQPRSFMTAVGKPATKRAFTSGVFWRSWIRTYICV